MDISTLKPQQATQRPSKAVAPMKLDALGNPINDAILGQYVLSDKPGAGRISKEQLRHLTKLGYTCRWTHFASRIPGTKPLGTIISIRRPTSKSLAKAARGGGDGPVSPHHP
jgi:hypothetical protein